MTDLLRIGLPKGRMERAVLQLLADGGVEVTPGARGYRPHVQLECVEAKVLKPQNIVEMLMVGSRDVGFAGADWVRELSADVIEVLDTRLDPVACPEWRSRPEGQGRSRRRRYRSGAFHPSR